MMRLKRFFLCDPWFRSKVLQNSIAILFGLNCTLRKERLVHINAIVIGVKCVKAFLKQIPLHAGKGMVHDRTTYKINHKFVCNEKCLIYLITCKKCSKQFIGQTIDTFRSCWND